jgi:hypothetical protein
VPAVRHPSGTVPGHLPASDLARWLARIGHLYPPGWFAAGGPVLTVRASDDRPLANSAPGGGYDLCGLVRHRRQDAPERVAMFHVPRRQRGAYYDPWRDRGLLVLDPEGDGVITVGAMTERRYAREREERRAAAAEAGDCAECGGPCVDHPDLGKVCPDCEAYEIESWDAAQ